jgi:exodeoxyribonuclease VII small subunit
MSGRFNHYQDRLFMSVKKGDKIGFGASFSDLEKIVEKFEREDLDLEEALKDFEKALTLARSLKERLAVVENKVVEIKKKFKDVLDNEKPPDASLGF